MVEDCIDCQMKAVMWVLWKHQYRGWARELYMFNLKDQRDDMWSNGVVGRNGTSAYAIPTAHPSEILLRAVLRLRSSVGRNGDPHAAYFPRGIPFGSLRHLPQSVS